jgi:hypothetical protein
MAKIVMNGSLGSFYAKNGDVLTKAVLYMSETMTFEMTEKWVGLSEDRLREQVQRQTRRIYSRSENQV